MKYAHLVRAMTEYLVECNAASHEQLADEDLSAEYDEVAADYENYGTDPETVRMVFEGAMSECAAVAKRMQKNKFK